MIKSFGMFWCIQRKMGPFTFPGHIIFLLTGLRIYTGEYKAQGPT